MIGAAPIQILLGPAVVLLAVRLLREAALIRSSWILISTAVMVGVASGLTSALGIAWFLGASNATLLCAGAGVGNRRCSNWGSRASG